MKETNPNRISVIRDNQLIPLLPSQTAEGREQPWRGVLLERHTISATEIPEHEHKDLCLHLQTDGEETMEWWSGGRHGVEKTSPGSIILLPAGTQDRIYWQGSERLILALRSELLNDIATVHNGHSPQFEAQWTLRDTSLQHLLSEMGREASEGWPLGRLYADLIATSLASLLLRRHAVDPIEPEPLRGGLPMPQLRRAMEYISTHLSHDLHLEEIANQVSLSPFHFARAFRSCTGQTPYQYLLDQRMERARHLLKNSSWSVQEIALMTGFRSPVNFVRAFRQRVGTSPGAWREGV